MMASYRTVAGPDARSIDKQLGSDQSGLDPKNHAVESTDDSGLSDIMSILGKLDLDG